MWLQLLLTLFSGALVSKLHVSKLVQYLSNMQPIPTVIPSSRMHGGEKTMDVVYFDLSALSAECQMARALWE